MAQTAMMAGLLLAAWLPGAQAADATCRPMTEAEVLKDLRTTLECADASPTGCECIANNATEHDCPDKATTAWESQGKKCVKAMSDKDADWNRHEGGWDYPSEYGESCKVHAEPGSYDCTKVEGQTHKFEHGNAGYNHHMNSSEWCTIQWCYVDPCKCNKKDFAKSSWFKPKVLYYSYSQCGGENKFSAAVCTAGKDKAGCEAISNCKWDEGTTSDTTDNTTVTTSGAWPQVVALWALALVTFAIFQ